MRLKHISTKNIALFVFLFLTHTTLSKLYTINKKPIKSYRDSIIYSEKGIHEETIYKYNNKTTITSVVPYSYRYTEVNKDKLKNYLLEKGSILAQEPYFSAIISSAEKNNLNPCLLFAITGREQSFVPVIHPKASKIANNPFNVFGSWQIYNTDIYSSADIACKTIVKLSADRPSNVTYLKWINSQNGTGGYAEDTKWWEGVDKFFKEMTLYTQ